MPLRRPRPPRAIGLAGGADGQAISLPVVLVFVGMRALVMEGSIAGRLSVREVIRQRGHEVMVCADVEAALAELERAPFDLLCIDLTLSGAANPEFIRKVRAQVGDEPVILLIANGGVAPGLDAAMAAGADDFMSESAHAELHASRFAVVEGLHRARQQRRAAETEELRIAASERTLLDALPVAVAVHRGGFLVYCNRIAASYLGFESPQDLVGENILALVHPDDRPKVIQRVQEIYSGRSVMAPPAEERFIRRDGTVIAGEVLGLQVDFEGAAATLIVVRDVTESHRLQTRLVIADRMASVGLLAAGVGHELNNPLAFVLSNLRLLIEELESLRGVVPAAEMANIAELLEDSADGAERMRVILRDLKTFSGAADERDQLVDVQNVLDSAISMAGNEIRHRAQLAKDYQTVPLVVGNESKLGQVFLNLVVNAAQAIEEGRADHHRITVRTRTDDEGRVVVVVEDTGSGIQEESVPFIFDPFFTTKAPVEGTGLGLSICHNIVTAAGGTIGVRTAIGGGSAFSVVLPPAPEHHLPSRKPLAAPRSARPTRRHVLVIDDEALIGRSVRRALRGHDVVAVTSGEEAIRRLRSGELFDVIVCDVMMPEVTGMDVYEAVKAMGKGIERRMVFMTGGAFTPRARAFLEGVDNLCLPKPFDLTQLREIIDAGTAEH